MIELICLNPDCTEASAFCSKCSIKGHATCRDQVEDYLEI